MSKGKIDGLILFGVFFIVLTAPNLVLGTDLSGRYNNSIVNYIVFTNGQFTYQYITTEYSLSYQTETTGEPVLERETLCVARGTFEIDDSHVSLYYDSDSCGLKDEWQTVSYDVETDTLLFDSKRFSKERTPAVEVQSRIQGQLALDQRPLTTTDVEAGVKAWQWLVAQAMQDLNNNTSGIWYCRGRSPHLNRYYWHWTENVGSGGWIPNTLDPLYPRVTPSSAIDWYFGSVSSSEGCTECLMAARASFYKGLLETIGPISFDIWFADKQSDLVISNRGAVPSPTRMNKPIQQEADLDRGDWVYFQNWVSSQTCPSIDPMQGENAITQTSEEPVTFIGLGMPGRGGDPVTGTVILDDLRRAWRNTYCPKTREGQLRKDLVMTASPSYFEGLANGLSLLTSLQINSPMPDISGTNGEKKFFKLVIPPDTGNLTVSTSGGTGNSDLYLMKEQWPTLMNHDYSSVFPDNEETVDLTGDISGTWYVLLEGSDDYTGVSLIATSDAPPPQDPCTKSIIPGAQGKNDNWDESCQSTHRRRSYAKYYTFTLTSETRIMLSLQSEIDTYLYLLKGTGSEGRVIAKNDDYNGSYNSMINKTLPPGDYTVEATTYRKRVIGEFDIRLGVRNTPPPVNQCLAPIDVGQTVTDRWGSGCISTHYQGRYAKYYTFTLSSEQEVTIDLQSSVDTYLYLLSETGENGNVLAQNDDSNGTYNSQIVRRLPAGSYTIEATTYSAELTGNFEVSLEY